MFQKDQQKTRDKILEGYWLRIHVNFLLFTQWQNIESSIIDNVSFFVAYLKKIKWHEIKGINSYIEFVLLSALAEVISIKDCETKKQFYVHYIDCKYVN